jgi:hypothetical protein
MGAEGVTEHRGIEVIKRILYGAGQPHEGTGIESYDIATNRFTAVVVLVDGDYVVRQHTQHSRTLKGRPYTETSTVSFSSSTGKARSSTLRSTGTRSMPIKFFSITGISNQLTRRGRPNVQSHK